MCLNGCLKEKGVKDMGVFETIKAFDARANRYFKAYGTDEFFDSDSLWGVFRFVVLFCFVFVFVLRHFGYFLSHFFVFLGWESFQADPYKARWYGRVAFSMAVIPCFLGVSFIFTQFFRRNNPRNGFCHRKERLMKRFPLLHDLVWGWPFILGLSCIYIGHPVDAVYAIFLGGLAYMVNHALSKASQPGLPVRFGLSLLIGSFTIWCWSRVCIELNGLPPGWQDVPVLPLWK